MAKKEKQPKKKKKPVVIVIKVIAIVLAVIVALGLAYIGYVYFSFHRIKDAQSLTIVQGEEAGSVPVNQELVITSYNIGFGAYSDDYTFFMDGGKSSWAFSEEAVHENIGGAMNTINETAPDIALFQEVDFDATRSYHIDERELVVDGMAVTGDYSYIFAQNYDSPFLMYPITKPHGKNKAGIMTFSKFQITHAVRTSLPIEEGLSKLLDLDRCYSKSRIPTSNGSELVIYNLHLSAYTTNAETAENQLAMIVKDMQNEYNRGNYCIAGGDFNRDLLGNSPEIFHTETLEDNWAAPVNEQLFTEDITLVAPFDETAPAASCRNPDKPYEVGDFVVTVDGFVKSPNVEVIYANVIDTGFQYSDHNPVMMKFKLN